MKRTKSKKLPKLPKFFNACDTNLQTYGIMNGAYQIHYQLIQKWGINAAVMSAALTAAYYSRKRKNELIENNGLYLSTANLSRLLCLTPHTINKCKEILKQHKFIKIKKVGTPAVEFYYLDFDVLHNLCENDNEE